MNCPVCTTEMVKARATNFGEEYDYCRKCKKELKELQKDSDPFSDFRISIPKEEDYKIFRSFFPSTASGDDLKKLLENFNDNADDAIRYLGRSLEKDIWKRPDFMTISEFLKET